MKVHIYTEEMYPVLFMDTMPPTHAGLTEVPDELYARYVKVEEAFWELQEELEEILNHK